MGALVLFASVACLGDPADAPPDASRSAPAAEQTFRIRQIYIEGSDDMGASAILAALEFRVGDRIPYRRLREAERRLARLGLFVVDPASGVRPRVAVGQDGDVSDVRVEVVRNSVPAVPR